MSGLLRALVRTAQWAFAALAALGMAQMLVWAADRKPPFELLSVEPAVATPGESVVLVFRVRRNVERDCAAILTRWVIDGKGVKIDLEGQQRISASAIRELEQRTPGMLITSVPVPLSAFPGDAMLVSDLEYICNPVQKWWWPINVTTIAPFKIGPRPANRPSQPAFRGVGV